LLIMAPLLNEFCVCRLSCVAESECCRCSVFFN
jgi:hypothetical protein